MGGAAFMMVIAALAYALVRYRRSAAAQGVALGAATMQAVHHPPPPHYQAQGECAAGGLCLLGAFFAARASRAQMQVLQQAQPEGPQAPRLALPRPASPSPASAPLCCCSPGAACRRQRTAVHRSRRQGAVRV